ncbi:hypothetical protein AQUCO_00100368v1 [Aquilegia coerulea]|uniref:Glycosyltransferases n=1 Tax=Aquilegia coerulea TaxID=218851 RepID=A0A2G5FA81_AQUCA|nr:hypothetical protein AQUCO_00100368v1 [Aquilegia coerulea]PIA64849.1 hypothetical protein AQUCO_00100368v1 [Aquilegia coerulea]PIA64850.1 hypothetical protein AQUCO_00100368v1 [Aquilegia coerulea]
MASIRRTLSPVPRAGAIRNGETHSVLSPLSKSSNTQSHLQSGGTFSTVLGSVDSIPILYKIQTVIFNLFSKRSSRPLDRSKPKGGPHWLKAFFHLFVCFMLGIFIGLTPFVPKNLSVNLVSKNQAFIFETTPLAGNAHQNDGTTIRIPPLSENNSSENNTVVEKEVKKQELIYGIPDDSSSVEHKDLMLSSKNLLIIVTPTYARPFQAYYLHRLAHTLRLVPSPLLWIVVEISSQSSETADILRRTGVMYRHLVCDKNLTNIRDTSVHQRNVALAHIETHRLNGIVYFADDNNMYSVDLFEHIREIRRFGTWPIAMLTENKKQTILEGPVCTGSQVNGWHTSAKMGRMRRFHSDISGFAFNSTILWDPKRWHRPTLEHIRELDRVKSIQGSTFIEQLVEDESQMEGFLNCSRIMVWHLQLEASHSFYPRRWSMTKNLDVVAPLT